MNRTLGFVVLVVTFMILLSLSLDQPYITDTIPDTDIIAGVDEQTENAIEQEETNQQDEETQSTDNIEKDNNTNSENQNNNIRAGSSKIYTILGESGNLTTEQMDSVKKWRSEIVKYAEEDPSQIFVNGFTSEKMICLTFNDGPDDQVTPQVLNILKQYHVKASFFFTGSQLEQNPEIVKRAYQDGHLVLSHSWSHQPLILLSQQEIRKEIQMTEDKIYELIGERPLLIRPPAGYIDKNAASVIKNKGYKIVLWSIDSMDWTENDKSSIVKNVSENIRPGDIILMHCDSANTETVKALPEIITKLRQKGYQFVDLGEMLQINPYR
ncbi:MAG: polysaccharide deacetylase family protein [Thermacetogeniaceae bacterium]|nr:polysaccharide deacetylase family protein [Syntrophomonadaceae bacterium]